MYFQKVKKLWKNLFFVGILWAPDEKSFCFKLSQWVLYIYFGTVFPHLLLEQRLHSWGSNSQPELFKATLIHSKLCNAKIILFNRFLMHFEQAVRRNGKKGFNCLCQSRNSPVFNPSALRHGGIWGAADVEKLFSKILTFISSNSLTGQWFGLVSAVA
jgi:hypothetical protein